MVTHGINLGISLAIILRNRAAVGMCLLAVIAVTSNASAEDAVRFSKIANDGTPVSEAVSFGAGSRDWGCTRDETSGLMWEVKSLAKGFRYHGWTYTPYDSNPESNGGWIGYKDDTSGRCLRSAMDERSCNTEAYVNAVNREGLCGFKDWRLPSFKELVAVATETARENPSTTSKLLPNIADGWYWTAVENVGVTNFSRVVLLPRAGRPHFYDGSYLVLVVRDDGKKN